MKLGHLLLVDVDHSVDQTIVSDTVWLWSEQSAVIPSHSVLCLKFHHRLLWLHIARVFVSHRVRTLAIINV